MGWCTEFGCRIRDGCDHAMVAGRKACVCQSCAVVCQGRFAGCPEVWATGPHPVPAPTVKPSSIAVPHPGLESSAIKPSATSSGPGVPDAVKKSLASLRRDVAAVHLDLSDTVLGLKHVRDTIHDQSESLRETVESLRRDLAAVCELVVQQQAMLREMAEQGAMTKSRSPLERMIHDRRARAQQAPAETGNGEPVSATTSVPNFERSQPNGHTDFGHPAPPLRANGNGEAGV